MVGWSDAWSRELSATLPLVEALVGPTLRPDRIDSLDVLRGIAILGILAMNVVSFAEFSAAYIVPTLMPGGVGGVNGILWTLQRLFADQKFMTLFAMMFGAGIVLSTRRADAAGSAWTYHYRRMGSLFVLGMLHAYLVWHGDILVLYAVCGCVAFFGRKLAPATLLYAAAGCLVGGGLILTAMLGMTRLGISFGDLSAAEVFGADATTLDGELAAIREGSYLAELSWRMRQNLFIQPTFVFLYGPRVVGLMFLGMALLKLGLMDASTPARRFVPLLLIGLLAGLPLTALETWRAWAVGHDLAWMFTAGFVFNYFSSVLLALGYVAGIMLLCKVAGRFTAPFAAVGRLALTNYLLQSLLATAFFYTGGRFHQWERVDLLWFVLGVWALQLTLSPAWLRLYRFGPAEWLWRSINYLRPQPLLRSAHA